MKEYLKKILFALLILTASVYFVWRVTDTFPLSSVPGMTAAVILLATELTGTAEMLIHFRVLLGRRRETVGGTQRLKPEEMPDVDILIPTCGEPVQLLRDTVLACRKLKYPQEKLHIYLCDDADSAEMSAMAHRERIGYFARADRTNAKAGNLNAALKKTASPLVAVFDADMQPKSSFLRNLLPYFLEDEKLGFVQTPQHFRNKDLFQPFLSGKKEVPDEQAYFYQCIEPASSRFNGVILAGSNVLIRREALEEAGGFAEWTLTEDFATGMEIERLGWHSLAVSEVMAEGLFPERFSSLIRQRIRWARGCIRSGRQGKKRGLSLLQRLHYRVSVQYWYFPLKRLIYLAMPLLYALFGIPVLRANLWKMAAFWLPFYLLSTIGLWLYSDGVRTVHRSVFYEYCLMPYLLLPVLAESLGLRKKEFEVTEKGGNRENGLAALIKLLLPHLFLLALTAAGVCRVMMKLPGTMDALPVFLLFWLVYDAALHLQAVLFLLSCRNRKVL